VGTGRDLATKRVEFKDIFLRYSISHLAPAVDMVVLLLVTSRFSSMGLAWYVNATGSLWVVVVGWLLAPVLYNPFAFSLTELRTDWPKWTTFLRSADFEDFYYGQKAGEATGSLMHNNWFCWLNVEPTSLKRMHAVFRLAIYGLIGLTITAQVMYLPGASGAKESRTIQYQYLQGLMLFALSAMFAYSARIKTRVVQLVLFLLFLGTLVASVLIKASNLFDAAFQLLLALYCLGKAVAASLELCLLAWAAAPHVDSRRPQHRPIASREKLLLPRNCSLLVWRGVLACTRLHAELQALLCYSVAFALTVLLAIPLSLLIGLLLLSLTFTLTPDGSSSVGPLAVERIENEANSEANAAVMAAAYRLGNVAMVLSVLLSAVGALVVLGGHKPRSHLYSGHRFQLLTLNLNSVHSWLIMNASVARYLAEKDASRGAGPVALARVGRTEASRADTAPGGGVILYGCDI